MNRERILAVLYDLALTISSEVRLRPLLTRTLQRLLYHTSFPAGVAFLDIPAGDGEIEVELHAAVGDFELTGLIGRRLCLPVALLHGQAEILQNAALFDRLPVHHHRYRIGLRLPMPETGVILLLAPALPEASLPLTQIFQPVMANLAKAVLLCRNNEAHTHSLESDRDQARAELAQQLRIADQERRFLRSLYDAIPDLVWMKDENGVFLACNPAFEVYFGAPEDQIIGKTDYDFVDHATADFYRNHDRRAATSPTPRSNKEWLVYPNGQRVLVETTKTAVCDADGKLIGVLGVARSIMEQLRTTEKLRESERRLHALFNNMAEGVALHDPILSQLGDPIDYRIIECNPQFEHILNISKPDAVGKLATEIYAGTEASFLKIFIAVATTGQPQRTELYFPLLEKYLDISIVPWNWNGLAIVFSDITERHRVQEQLQRAANYDALTQLPNRLLLSDRLRQAVAHVKRSNKLLAVCYLDLDNFKPVNDRYGHEVGDHLLINIAKRLQTHLRTDDTVARLGGDEFVLLLADLDNFQETEIVLKRILTAITEPCEFPPHRKVSLSASLGVTLFPNDATDPDALLRHADQAMYLAKQAGRNRYYFFDPDQDRQQQAQRDALHTIEAALETGQFQLYYQPKVDMRHGQVIGAEALIRWQHPERGLLAPSEFLPLIENTVLDSRLGEWVIETALSHLETWLASGLPLAVSVNISAAHLQQSDFVAKLAGQIHAHPAIPPHALKLEVLESAALQDINHVSKLIKECHQFGVDFALDDFGTGYSSLTYLKHLPAAILKIDQSFVHDMLHDPEDLAIVDGVIGLAQSFERQVIAEGVETEEHGTLLLQLGCDLAQGYGIARPMPAEAIPDWVARYCPPPTWANFADTEPPERSRKFRHTPR
ncbi:MAG: EAL domain-containing protein [Candidatus Competibacteraceae bacterium]